MPNRILKERLLRDMRVDKLSDFEECTLCRLLLAVDDFGNIDGRPNYLKSILYPTKEGVETEQILAAFARLTELGLVTPYEVDGATYFHFTDFENDQKLRYRKCVFPKLETDAKQKLMEMLK